MIVRYLSLSSVFSSVMANLLVAISQTSQEERTQLVSIANVERLRYSEKKKQQKQQVELGNIGSKLGQDRIILFHFFSSQ